VERAGARDGVRVGGRPGLRGPAGGEDESALDGELEGGDVADSEDALSAREVTAYAPIAPPEHRVTTASISARVGAPSPPGASSP